MEEEKVVEEVTENVISEAEAYDRINRLNMALDELANDMAIDTPEVDSDIKLDNVNTEEISNEIAMPEVNAAEVEDDLKSSKIEEELADSDDDTRGSKGQFILIIILTLILIALFVAMYIFTNAL